MAARADRRAHCGDVAQQEVEVIAAPVVKDHWDGLGRLGRDVAGVAQRPEILPGAVAVVEFLLGGLEGRKALPAVSGGPVLQLLPPGHADGPSSASPGEVVVGQLEKIVQHTCAPQRAPGSKRGGPAHRLWGRLPGGHRARSRHRSGRLGLQVAVGGVNSSRVGSAVRATLPPGPAWESSKARDAPSRSERSVSRAR